MKLYGLTVTRNEVGRYLPASLVAASKIVDAHLVYDDDSDDGTVEVAAGVPGVTAIPRPTGAPSFLEDESAFRMGAWDSLTDCGIASGDWVLILDADEFLVTTSGCCTRCDVDAAIRAAEVQRLKGIIIPVAEVFALDDEGTPLVRTDGFWGQIAGCRLVRFEHDGIFDGRTMGCSPHPTYVGRPSRSAFGLHLLHYGYCRPEDQIVRYERYASLPGHNNAHVQSIVAPRKALQPWTGPIPELTA